MANNPRGRAESRDLEITEPIIEALVTQFQPINASTAPGVFQLPALSTVEAGVRYVIKKTDQSTNAVTVVTTGLADRIDGAASKTITAAGGLVEVISDGTAWQLIQQTTGTVTGGGTGSAGSPTLGFTTAAPSTTVNVPTASITVRRLDGNGLADLAGDLVLGLGTPGSAVYLATDGTTVITSVTIPSGSSTASFKFRSPTAGSYPVTVTANGYTAITQQVTVAAGAALPTKLAFVTAAQNVTNSVVSAVMTVQLQDANSVPVNTDVARTINLTSDASPGSDDNFYAITDTAGATPITSRTMSIGTNSVSFLYKNITNGTPTITAADASGSATVTLDGSSPALINNALTIAAGSNGVNVSTFAGAGVLNLNAAPDALATSGQAKLSFAGTGGNAVITYTGKSGSTLTGCTTITNNGTTGVMTTGDRVVGNTVKTASFTPPAGSFLVARLGVNAYPEHITTSVADSFGLTWVPMAIQDGNPDPRGKVAIYGAACPTSQAMTVTATRTFSTSSAPGFALKVDVFTSVETAWGGAFGLNTNNDSSLAAPAVTVTTTRAGSRLLGVVMNDNGFTMAPGLNTTETDEYNLSGFVDVEFIKYTTDPSSIGSYTLASTVSSTSDWTMAAAEIRPGAGAITSATQQQTVAAASGGGAPSALAQKDANNIVWWDNNNAFFLGATDYNGSTAGGPTTSPGSTVVLRSFQSMQNSQWFNGSGGNEDWSTSASLAGSTQNQMIGRNFVSGVHSRGGKVFIGVRLWDNSVANGTDGQFRHSPVYDWYNDAYWTNLLDAATKWCTALKNLGADGIHFDSEQYNGKTWSPNFLVTASEATEHTEDQRRAKVRQRGAEFGAAVTAAFPGIEMAWYNSREWGGGVNDPLQFRQNPTTWNPLLTSGPNVGVGVNFWDGVFDSYAGIKSFYAQDASFFVTEPNNFRDLDTMHWFSMNDSFAHLSRVMGSNWVNMVPKVYMCAFLASEGDGTPYLKPEDATTQAAKLAAARRWNMGGLIPIFETSHFVGSNGGFDYSTGSHPNGGNFNADGAPTQNFKPALTTTAGATTNVQTTTPTLSNLAVVLLSAGNYRVTGRATSHGITGCVDAIVDGAIRQVKVKIGAGAFKVAPMTLTYNGMFTTAGNYQTLLTGVTTGWYQDFTVDLTGSASQTVTIIAEDTHLNTTTNTSLST